MTIKVQTELKKSPYKELKAEGWINEELVRNGYEKLSVPEVFSFDEWAVIGQDPVIRRKISLGVGNIEYERWFEDKNVERNERDLKTGRIMNLINRLNDQNLVVEFINFPSLDTSHDSTAICIFPPRGFDWHGYRNETGVSQFVETINHVAGRKILDNLFHEYSEQELINVQIESFKERVKKIETLYKNRRMPIKKMKEFCAKTGIPPDLAEQIRANRNSPLINIQDAMNYLTISERVEFNPNRFIDYMRNLKLGIDLSNKAILQGLIYVSIKQQERNIENIFDNAEKTGRDLWMTRVLDSQGKDFDFKLQKAIDEGHALDYDQQAAYFRSLIDGMGMQNLALRYKEK